MTDKLNSWAALKESMRLNEIKRRLKAALRRKPRPSKLKELNNDKPRN